MPRGHQDFVAEFVSVRRHELQANATSERAMRDLARSHAEGERVAGFQVSDDAAPLILNLEVEKNHDGPYLTAGSPFGTDPTWMRLAARELQRLADQADAETEWPETFRTGMARDEDCPRCGHPETGLTLGKEPTPSDEWQIFMRCARATDDGAPGGCGWLKNLGWFKAEYTMPVQAILAANAVGASATDQDGGT